MIVTSERPTGRQVAGRAWRNCFSAMRRMAPLFLCCILLLTAVSFFMGGQSHPSPAQEAWIRHPQGLPPSMNSWKTYALLGFSLVLNSILLAPVAVAVHRFILLGETCKGLFFLNRITLRFSALMALFYFIDIGVTALRLKSSPIAAFFVPLIYWSFIAWTLMLFPSIAVEEQSTSFAKRLDTAIGRVKGNFWLIVRAGLLTALPPFLILLLVVFTYSFSDPKGQASANALILGMSSLPGLLALSALSAVSIALGAAVASSIYGYASGKPAAPVSISG